MPIELLATIVASKLMWLPSICVLGMSEKYSVSKDKEEIRAKKRVLLKLHARLIYSNETEEAICPLVIYAQKDTAI